MLIVSLPCQLLNCCLLQAPWGFPPDVSAQLLRACDMADVWPAAVWLLPGSWWSTTALKQPARLMQYLILNLQVSKDFSQSGLNSKEGIPCMKTAYRVDLCRVFQGLE